MRIEEGVASLQELGFTELEATIYCFLQRESPATGYRIAQSIGKPTANTYKAIAQLQSRGAVQQVEGANRLCRATPPEELLAQMGAQFDVRRTHAAETLAKLGSSPQDERVYRLKTREQILERARQMLRRSSEVALVSAFPEPLEAIRPEMEDAAARGITVIAKSYRPIEISGVYTVLSTEPASMLETWPGQELSLVIDAEETLQALLQAGESLGIWSGNVFLAFHQYNGLYCELMLTTLMRNLHDTSLREQALASFPSLYHPANTPGYRKLLRGLPPS